MNAGLSVVVDDSTLEAIESIAKQCAPDQLAVAGEYKQTFILAAGINELRKSITPAMLNELMALQGSSLGFRTDKDPGGGYSAEIVKECAIEVVLRGGRWTGNEFNIIAERVYLTKEYFTRKVREFPGLTNLKHYPGVPQMANGGALVPYSLTWDLNGRPDRLDRKLTRLSDGTEIDERICVRVNSGMGADAVLGKAERKILAALYKRLLGAEVPDGDPDEAPVIDQRKAESIQSLSHRVEAPKKEPEEEVFDLAIVERKFARCKTFTEISKYAAELRGKTPAEHKNAVAALDEKARDRVKIELAAMKK